MKFVIIGGVAAGTKTAAKLKRENPDAEVVLYTKGNDISYAGCGLPYYVGGSIESRDEIIVNTPEKFMKLTGVTVYTGSEAEKVLPESKTVIVNGSSVSYDKLILAVGANPIIPPVDGVNLPGVFTVRTPDDSINMRNYLPNAKKAVVVGGGFIGLEMADNLMAQGLSVTVIDMADQLLPNILDADMSDFLRRKLQERNLRILTGTALNAINGSGKVESISTSAGTIPADMVVLSVGIRPATKFIEGTGIETERGLIITDYFGKTNLEDIYAVGDCAMVENRITGRRQWSAMGSTANIAGRALALSLSGEKTAYPGCLGTGVLKASEDLNVGRTGLTEEQAEDAGHNVITAVSVTDDKAHYYPDSDMFVTKLIADRNTHELLGIQVIGARKVCL